MQDQTSPRLAILPLHLLGALPGLGHGSDSLLSVRHNQLLAGNTRNRNAGAWQVSVGETKLQVVCFRMCLQVWSLHVELINCWRSWKGCFFFK